MEKSQKKTTSMDIETKLNIQERINNISKKIDKKRETYELTVEHLKKGYDITVGKEINNKDEINRRIREERDKFYDYKQRKISQMIDIEYEIDEKDIDVDDKTIISTEDKIQQRKIKNRSLRNIKTILAAEILGATIVLGTLCGTIFKCHEDEINRKTEEYRQELDDVVTCATYGRSGNVVYDSYGDIVEYVDDDMYTSGNYTFIKYDEIADFIENSDNPDLAAFTLYRYYGMSHNPDYNKIVKKTFRSLEFEGSEDSSLDNFDTYLKNNGYSNYDEYYRATRNELFSDGDSELDNIKVKIKKMTR